MLSCLDRCSDQPGEHLSQIESNGLFAGKGPDPREYGVQGVILVVGLDRGNERYFVFRAAPGLSPRVFSSVVSVQINNITNLELPQINLVRDMLVVSYQLLFRPRRR